MGEIDAISIQKAAEFLGVSRTQVYRLMDIRVLKETIVVDRRMVTKSSVLEYAALLEEKRKIKEKMRNLMNAC